jgi:hypothetical protein
MKVHDFLCDFGAFDRCGSLRERDLALFVPFTRMSLAGYGTTVARTCGDALRTAVQGNVE